MLKLLDTKHTSATIAVKNAHGQRTLMELYSDMYSPAALFQLLSMPMTLEVICAHQSGPAAKGMCQLSAVG